jgi:hypothetical protein
LCAGAWNWGVAFVWMRGKLNQILDFESRHCAGCICWHGRRSQF